jgi:hypothetical protein
MTKTSENIKCPSCGHKINVSDLLYHQVEEKIKQEFYASAQEMKDRFDKKEIALKKEQAEFEQRRDELETIIKKNTKERLTIERAELEKQVREETLEQLNVYKQELQQKSDEVKELNKTRAELERAKREKHELQDKIQAEAEIKLNEMLTQQKDALKKELESRSELKLIEKQTLIDSLNEKLSEAQRKISQGSMQVQGEVQEIAIEEWLKTNFPLDSIDEVKKGARGADCIQIVNSRYKQNCGSIYYESKRTKDFQYSWIEKFKADMRDRGATFGVLVTDVMPKDLDRLGQKDGIWICTLEEFKGLSFVLRESVLLLNDVLSAQENKGDKMHMLYDFLTGGEFRMQVEAIVEGFVQMKSDLDSEKRSMESIWKKREKQISKVVLNTTHMYSSIKGIAGNAIGGIQALELPA